MNTLSLGLVACCLALSGLALAADDKAPMPQTRGMQGMDPKFHDQTAKPAADCVPKAGSEHMAHAPKDHPMPGTKGMKDMSPEQHMRDCQDPSPAAPIEKGPHEHKAPGKG